MNRKSTAFNSSSSRKIRQLFKRLDELDTAVWVTRIIYCINAHEEIASAQYREGLSGQLELTDSEVALRQSEFNYAQAVYDYLVARAQLDEATGRVPLVDVDIATSRGS